MIDTDELIELSVQPISARFGDCKDVKEFVQPNSFMVVQIIESLDINKLPSEDEKILKCWDWVVREIKYPLDRKTFALTVYGKTIRSDDYFLEPGETIAFKVGKCDATSNLLVSMLRNFMPADRVYVVLGDLHNNGVGGHAWVLVDRMADRTSKSFYLETTLSKLPGQPWAKAEQSQAVYHPVLYYNDKQIFAEPNETMCALPFDNCKVRWLSDYFCGICGR